MARISELIAAGRTFSFEFFPPKTEMAQLTLGRTIAPPLSRALGQSVVVENRPGANTVIATEIVARAPPGGKGTSSRKGFAG